MNLDQKLDQAEDLRLSGEYDDAKTSYHAIIEEGHTDHTAHVHALRGLAEVYRMLENFEASEDQYKKAIDGYSEINHAKGLGYAYLGLGQLKRHQNKTSDAMHNIETAANYFLKCNDQYGQADAHIEMGHLYLLAFNYAVSKVKFSEANEIYASLNDTWGMASAKLGLGKAVLKEREYINSEKELGAALELFTSIGDKLGQANANKELGNLFNALNKTDDAKNYFNHALSLYEAMKETAEAEKLQQQLNTLDQ